MKVDIYNNKFVQAFIDFKNFLKFKKEIKRELKNPDSKMNTLDIKRNWLGNILYTQLNCNDTDFMNAGYSYDRMLMIKLKPVVTYLGTELGWGDYLVPQVPNFVDENGEPSLSYGVLFIFTGYSLTLTKILFTVLILSGLLGFGIYELIKYFC